MAPRSVEFVGAHNREVWDGTRGFCLNPDAIYWRTLHDQINSSLE